MTSDFSGGGVAPRPTGARVRGKSRAEQGRKRGWQSFNISSEGQIQGEIVCRGMRTHLLLHTKTFVRDNN